MPLHATFFELFNQRGALNAQKLCGLIFYAFCLGQRLVNKAVFYRIKKIEEVYDMGYEDYFYSGHLCFLEWPELIEDLLPEDAVKVEINVNADGTRTVKF